MDAPRPLVVDFETFGVEGRPNYPPQPVGVALMVPGEKPRYLAWGHPTGNNCRAEYARKELGRLWGRGPLLFHNAKFDVDVAVTTLELPQPKWDNIHDTLPLLFLDDPHAPNLKLKPSAERVLRMKPDEQDAVRDWLVSNQPVPGTRISESEKSLHSFGRYIAYAPGWLVGEYACGDVVRTAKLFDKLWQRCRRRNMLEAYDRERRLMPALLEMERQGVPVNVRKLTRDVAAYHEVVEKLEHWLRVRLRCARDINLDSGAELLDVLRVAKLVDVKKLPLTETGKPSTSKEALAGAMTDAQVLAVLEYRRHALKCLGTFMGPWLATARKSSGGLIFTQWNSTKQPEGGGARTGRLSSTPNFQNIPKEFAPLFAHEKKGLPRAPFKLPPLPLVRAYIQAFAGHVLVDRDYSQQEPRILAHFDGGALLAKYNEEPWIDFHDYAREMLAQQGKVYDRRRVKNTNLGLIYGMGVGQLAERNDMSVSEAAELKRAILALYPGLREMYSDMRQRAAKNEPIRTWGGREYYCEPSKVVNGRFRKFDYKLVNVLIQGSAADCTKEAIIRFAAKKRRHWRLLLNVHDQLTASVPKHEWRAGMACMREAMESVEFDVPMLTEGSVSHTHWNALKTTDKKGRDVA